MGQRDLIPSSKFLGSVGLGLRKRVYAANKNAHWHHCQFEIVHNIYWESFIFSMQYSKRKNHIFCIIPLFQFRCMPFRSTFVNFSNYHGHIPYQIHWRCHFYKILCIFCKSCLNLYLKRKLSHLHNSITCTKTSFFYFSLSLSF